MQEIQFEGFKLLFSKNSNWINTRTISLECHWWQNLLILPQQNPPEYEFQLLTTFSRFLDLSLMFETSLHPFPPNKSLSLQT